MGLVGFKKKPYEGLPFTICPGNVFNARIMSTLNMGDDNENKQGMTKKQIRLMEKKKKEEKKKEHEDILEYMKNLDSWDKKYIYKPQTPIVSQQTNINNENENEINPENQESNQENKK
jgi:hypothetical protein